jgi:hypothetical protein
MRHGLFHQVRQRRGVAQIGLQRQHAARPRQLEREGGLLQFIAGAVGVQDHVVTGLVQVRGDGRADTARAAGNQGDRGGR